MTVGHVGQIAVGLVAVLTPWVVIRTALAMSRQTEAARRLGRDRLAARLNWAAIASAAAIATLGALLTPPSLAMGAIDLLMFATLSALAWPLLCAIDRETAPARHVEATLRVASLRPRRIADYSSVVWRALPIVAAAIGLVALAVRLTQAGDPERRLFVPVAFVLIAPVFAALHEIWLRQVVTGGAVADGFDLDRRIHNDVRIIQTWEVVLAFVGLGPSWAGRSALRGARVWSRRN